MAASLSAQKTSSLGKEEEKSEKEAGLLAEDGSF